MSEIITISCPSCGGMLTRAPNTTTYTCDYCGQSHRLRMEDVEEFGRCPICRRNDRVEKARAIYYKQGALSSRLGPPLDPRKSLIYEPNKKPKPKPQQRINKKTSNFTCGAIIVFGITMISTFLFIGVSSAYGTNIIGLAIILFIMMVSISIALRLLGSDEEKKFDNEEYDRVLAEWKSNNDKIDSEWAEYIKDYDKTYGNEYALQSQLYSRVMQRYDSVYYCHRDDIVFIPGESGHAPSDQLENFLYQKPTEK